MRHFEVGSHSSSSQRHVTAIIIKDVVTRVTGNVNVNEVMSCHVKVVQPGDVPLLRSGVKAHRLGPVVEVYDIVGNDLNATAVRAGQEVDRPTG